jgi:hypothetical protein
MLQSFFFEQIYQTNSNASLNYGIMNLVVHVPDFDSALHK